MTSIAARALARFVPLVGLLLVATGCDQNQRCPAGPLPPTWARFDGVIPPSMTVCRRDPATDPAEVEVWHDGSASAASAAAATHLAAQGWRPEGPPRNGLQFFSRGPDGVSVNAASIKGRTRVFFRASTSGCAAPARDGAQCIGGTTVMACTAGVGTRVVQECVRGCEMVTGAATATCR